MRSQPRTTIDVAARPSATPLPATLALGPVHLTVADLDRSVAWYETALGLRTHRRDAGSAELGDGSTTVLVLVEDPGASAPGRMPGSTTTRFSIRRVRSWRGRRCA